MFRTYFILHAVFSKLWLQTGLSKVYLVLSMYNLPCNVRLKLIICIPFVRVLHMSAVQCGVLQTFRWISFLILLLITTNSYDINDSWEWYWTQSNQSIFFSLVHTNCWFSPWTYGRLAPSFNVIHWTMVIV